MCGDVDVGVDVYVTGYVGVDMNGGMNACVDMNANGNMYVNADVDVDVDV